MSDQAFNEAEEASSLLQMARQLHEQYVSSARTEAEKILSSAKTEAQTLLSAASEESALVRLNAKAELEGLEASIARAREFEGVYRESIRVYLSNLLSEVQGIDGPSLKPLGAPDYAPIVVAPVAAPAFEPAPVIESYIDALGDMPEFLDTPGVIDPDLTFRDDALDSTIFDKLAEPDASSEDVNFDVPVSQDFIGPRLEADSFPSFDSSPEDTPEHVDSVEDILSAAAEIEAESLAAPVSPAEASTSDDIDSLLDSLAELNSTDVDNDGGSTVDSIKDGDSTTGSIETVDELFAPAPPVAASMDIHGEHFGPPVNYSDIQVDEPFVSPPAVESFDEIFSAPEKGAEEGEKKDFSFFGKK